jgi:hypothetical protein
MRRVLLAIALALVVAACASASSGSSGGSSGVYGRVLKGGPCPVSLEVQRCRDHAVKATIAVMKGRTRAATVKSASDGHFRRALAPGTYRLVPSPRGDSFAPPVKVVVASGKFVRVTIRYHATNR